LLQKPPGYTAHDKTSEKKEENEKNHKIYMCVRVCARVRVFVSVIYVTY